MGASRSANCLRRESENAMQNPNPNRVRLYEHEGATASTIDAKIMPDGSLEVSGYDIGEFCQEFYGHDDVESFITVLPKDKDQLLLALLEAKFAGDPQASSHFREFVDRKRVPHDFDIWP